MKKIFIIIEREYLTRVKKRSFLITTIIAPLGFALFFIGVVFLSGYGSAKKKIALLDENHYFEGKIADEQALYFTSVDTPLRVLEMHYKQMGFDGILYIPKLTNYNNVRTIEYRSDKNLGIKTQQYIEEEIKRVIKNLKIEQAQIDKEVIHQLNQTDVRLKTIVYGDSGETKSGSTLIASAMGYIMGFAIYMILFIYGNMVMRSVIEEKNNRILEVMASAVKPFQLMMGKIIGVGAVGLTQFLLWGILIFITNIVLSIVFSANLEQLQQTSTMTMGSSNEMPEQYELAMAIQSLKDIQFLPLFIYFIIYFFGGYLLYGSLFAAIGAAAGDDQDNQSLNFIVSLPIILAIFIMMTAIQEPENSLAFWGAIIPFTSPIVMPALIPFGVPAWQIALSIFLLILGFLSTAWLAAKIYRVGILMYGKKVTLTELFKWIRY